VIGESTARLRHGGLDRWGRPVATIPEERPPRVVVSSPSPVSLNSLGSVTSSARATPTSVATVGFVRARSMACQWHSSSFAAFAASSCVSLCSSRSARTRFPSRSSARATSGESRADERQIPDLLFEGHRGTQRGSILRLIPATGLVQTGPLASRWRDSGSLFAGVPRRSRDAKAGSRQRGGLALGFARHALVRARGSATAPAGAPRGTPRPPRGSASGGRS
jgi:hypothetical protein